MNLFIEAFLWLTDPARFEGVNSIQARVGEHLFYTFIAIGLAAVVAIPIGWLIGHTGRGREFAIAMSGAARAIPSFGLILLLVLVLGVLNVPLGTTTAFVILAVPSILAGAYSGIEAVDRRVVDAARAVGMTEWQILWKVEVPLGLPLLISGLRAGALQVVATATLAAYVGLGGLGYYLIEGLRIRNYDEILAGALLIVVLALLIDGAFALLQHFVVPRGVTAFRAPNVRSSSSRRRAVVGTPIEQREG